MEEKPFSEYSKKQASSKDGHVSYCKVCAAVKLRDWRANNPEKSAAHNRAYRVRYPEKSREQNRRSMSERYAKDPSAFLARVAQRRAKKLRATPSWSEPFFIEEAYRLATLRTKMTGFPWEVDHIVPLVSDRVCGLHTHDNIAVIPASINQSKGNRYWPDMP